MNEIDFSIRNAQSTDRSRLANLIHFGSYTHQHLDWKSPLEWIGSEPYLLVEKNGDLFAALACPPDLPKITWIRLFVVNSLINFNQAWKFLWGPAKEKLSRIGNNQVAAISLQSWFNELLERSGFEHKDNVVVLIWERSTPLQDPALTNIQIRMMMHEDLNTIEKIDHESFGSMWKNSLESLELAFQQSSIASVAQLEEEIVGYQFSTTSSMGGHLARLAVKTSMQGRGIGYSMIHQLLIQFRSQGVRHVTVNTQQSNIASLALYSKAGFNITGESYRVYEYNIFEQGTT
jgi:ribosomal protein S18 acetylase RimI-like enzyme